MAYTVVLVHERQGGYSVYVPALPGCRTQGDDVPEATVMRITVREAAAAA